LIATAISQRPTINAVVWGDTGIVVDAIVLSGDKPVLATASIGASLVPESLRVLTGVLGQKQSLQTLMAEPALLSHIDFSAAEQTLAFIPVSIPQGTYTPAFLAKVKAAAKTGRRNAADQPGVMVFNESQ